MGVSRATGVGRDAGVYVRDSGSSRLKKVGEVD